MDSQTLGMGHCPVLVIPSGTQADSPQASAPLGRLGVLVVTRPADRLD